MNEALSVLPLSQADQPTVVAVAINDDRARVGIALPNPSQKGTDLYLTQAATNDIRLESLYRAAQFWAPAILGMLQFNQFECEGDTKQDQADTVVTLQALAVEGLDQLLKDRGQSTVARPHYISQFQQETHHTLHSIHETDDPQWRHRLQPAMAQAGGVGEVVIYRNLGPDQMKQLQVIQLPGVDTQATMTNDNGLVTQAFSQEVLPRLQATNSNYDQLVEQLLLSAQENLPVTESIRRSVGLRMKKLWNGK